MGIFDFIKEVAIGPNVERDEEWREAYSAKCSEIREYQRTGARPMNTRCEYAPDGRMVWNEATGICGPASWIE